MAGRPHLRQEHRRMPEVPLREHLSDVEVRSYGSRVGGRGHDGSDLLLRGPGLKRCGNRASPLLVDRFHREIERRRRVLTEGRQDVLRAALRATGGTM